MDPTYVADYEMRADDRNAYYTIVDGPRRRRRDVRIAAFALLGGPVAVGPLLWVTWPEHADWLLPFALLVPAGAGLWWCAARVGDVFRVRRWNRAWELGPCRELLTAEGMQSSWPPGQSATVRWTEVEYIRRTPEHIYIKAFERGYWIPFRAFGSDETVNALWASLERWAAAARAAAPGERTYGDERPTMFAPSRRRVLEVLLSSAALCLSAAWTIAAGVRSWQATHDPGNDWLLPINNTRFWFPILLAGSVLGIAAWSHRPRAWAVIGLASVLAAQAASVWFWANRASRLPAGVTRTVALRAQGADVVTVLWMSALTLFGFAAVALGIRDLLRKESALVDRGIARDVRDVFS